MKNFFLVMTVAFCFLSCDNDDGNATNESQCNYEGLSYYDVDNDDETLIPESNLTTTYYPNNSGPGIPAVEIYKTDDVSMVFTTDVVTLNATGTGDLTINNGQTTTVNVICQRAGTAVGEEFRYDITLSGFEVEFCVVIDGVNP
ncbi:hypothetical protein I2486_19765 [Cellulophaga sp. E16_2]|uniref:Uncharacterized protein n=1 Tax=Cellulophaga algicola (strain DSM 14237 / IC166 / ACAM 630) TaxID=688270 RepID=E6XDR4_CELAD|nr:MULTISPECIES: hypothetical protein [Cellulophaga]ADV51252.1 hypothetical protein Celal_4008 [Cellulophaga algicola DSM 14237]MBO0593642.1 hypothetical protein [Cellulophaga sp. E16_2]